MLAQAPLGPVLRLLLERREREALLRCRQAPAPGPTWRLIPQNQDPQLI